MLTQPPPVGVLPDKEGEYQHLTLWLQFAKERLDLEEIADHVRQVAASLGRVVEVQTFRTIMIGVQRTYRGKVERLRRSSRPLFTRVMSIDEFSSFTEEVDTVLADRVVRIFSSPRRLHELKCLPDRLLTTSAITEDAVLHTCWYTMLPEHIRLPS